MHFVRLGPLKPRTKYFYAVKGGTSGWSATASFRSAYTAADGGTTRVGIFGDMAITQFNAVGNLAADCSSGVIDAIWRNRWRALLAVDDLVEALVATVDARGQMEETYFCFTSDHGFRLGQHNIMIGKRHPHDVDTQIPLDVIYIKSDGVIAKIVRQAVPFSLQSLSSETPVQGILEIGGGQAEALGIQTGDVVEHAAFGTAQQPAPANDNDVPADDADSEEPATDAAQ